MATTNYQAAEVYQQMYPHSFVATQKLVVAMAKYVKNENKKTWFGRDKGLIALKKFEEKLYDLLLAMVMDEIVVRNASSYEYRLATLKMVENFEEVFPNWEDAYGFSELFFVERKDIAEDLISSMLRN